jgi:hypothetical protein
VARLISLNIINLLNMEKLDTTINQNHKSEGFENPSKGYGKIKMLIMSAVMAVAPGVIGCSSDYKKCAGKSGKADLQMLDKWEDRCTDRAERFINRTGHDDEDILHDKAYRACKILNNKSFDVERNLERSKETAELKEDDDKAKSCRKAIADAREKGEKGASLINKIEGAQ